MTMGFTRSEIQNEYQAAMAAAENEYKTSVDAARRLLESKRKTARETMQTKIKALEQDLEKQRNETTREVSKTTAHAPIVGPVQTFQDKSWNVSWNRTGVWSGSMPVRLFGH